MKRKVTIKEPDMRLVGRKYDKTVSGYKTGGMKVTYDGYTLAIGRERVPLCHYARSAIGVELDENEIASIRKIVIHFGCEDD